MGFLNAKSLTIYLSARQPVSIFVGHFLEQFNAASLNRRTSANSRNS